MPDTTTSLLSMHGIYKAFPGVQALENVDFDLQHGELHALVAGQNQHFPGPALREMPCIYHAWTEGL